MPKGPRGQKRPADAIGLAVMIGKIATGEIVEKVEPIGQPGGLARSKALPPKRRVEIAKKAANSRWKKDQTVVEAETSERQLS